MGRLSGPVAAHLGLPSLSHLRDIIRLSAQAVADLNCHKRLLAVSHATRTFHVAGGLSAEKIHVLYNGVDLDEFCPRPPTGYLHRELGLPPESPLVGTIGQIGLRKGQDVLLHAAARIAHRAGDVHYVIVGQRNSEKEESRRFEQGYMTRCRRVPCPHLSWACLNRRRPPHAHDERGHGTDGLAHRVHFLGVRDDVSRLLNELTLLVHPARQEPLGRVLLEAAAAGLAIIATPAGGTPEIFPPEQNAARLVPPDDPGAVADAILELLGDPVVRNRLGIAARRRVEEQFDIRVSVGNLLRQYEDLV